MTIGFTRDEVNKEAYVLSKDRSDFLLSHGFYQGKGDPKDFSGPKLCLGYEDGVLPSCAYFMPNPRIFCATAAPFTRQSLSLKGWIQNIETLIAEEIVDGRIPIFLLFDPGVSIAVYAKPEFADVAEALIARYAHLEALRKTG